jgi:hypothetical protein
VEMDKPHNYLPHQKIIPLCEKCYHELLERTHIIHCPFCKYG